MTLNNAPRNNFIRIYQGQGSLRSETEKRGPNPMRLHQILPRELCEGRVNIGLLHFVELAFKVLNVFLELIEFTAHAIELVIIN